MIRKKNKFEKFFSLKRYRLRRGAKNYLRGELDDYTEIKKRVVVIEYEDSSVVNNKDMTSHFIKLKKEFLGESELLYYHAQLIVFIRREYNVKDSFRRFQDLWDKEGDFLLENLNSRWLVSAADTFVDYSKDEVTRSLGLAVSLFVNTIKLYETERLLIDGGSLTYAEEIILKLHDKKIILYDGLEGFEIGTEDTIRNMVWRLNAVQGGSITGCILKELFIRANKFDSIYKRFGVEHKIKATEWW